ncbi:MAG TPA: pilus assembly protein TadE [Anaerolineaceae bacterium]|nr:pilus assembly protein TadE [Anaerolineaceae bacterium]
MVTKRNHLKIVSRSRGQSLVEFALVLPLLLLLILGALDFGRLFHAQIVLTNAAREGAYYLSTHFDDETAAKEAAVGEAENSGIEIDIDDVVVGNCESQAECKKVTVSTTVTGLVLLDSFGLGERQASVEMRLQP